MIKLSRVIDFEVAAMDNAFERMDDPGRRAPLHHNRMFHGIGKEWIKSVARLRRNNAHTGRIVYSYTTRYLRIKDSLLM